MSINSASIVKSPGHNFENIVEDHVEQPVTGLAKDHLNVIASYLSPNELDNLTRGFEEWGKIITANQKNENEVWQNLTKSIGLNGQKEIRAAFEQCNTDSRGQEPPDLDTNILRTVAEHCEFNTLQNAKQEVTNSKNMICIGRDEWIKYIGDPGEVPPLPLNIHEILKSPCPFWPDKTVEQTHMLVLIPETIDGKPGYLREFLKILLAKTGIEPEYFWSKILDEDDKKSVTKSRWVLITKDVIPGSREKKHVEQLAMFSKIPGYQMTMIRETVIATYLEYLRTGKRLFPSSPFGQIPSTYTRCLEKIYESPLAVGGFAPAPGGLTLGLNYVILNPNFGAAGLREVLSS